ncbi:MAG: hypothetical protein P8Z72_15220 [Gammaproteobacteria bacterium]
MLLKTRSNEHLIEVANLIDLMNLNVSQVIGRSQEGEEQQCHAAGPIRITVTVKPGSKIFGSE